MRMLVLVLLAVLLKQMKTLRGNAGCFADVCCDMPHKCNAGHHDDVAEIDKARR
jgi:hypothetical protein